jgi:hypothetical protein
LNACRFCPAEFRGDTVRLSEFSKIERLLVFNAVSPTILPQALAQLRQDYGF